MGIGWQAYCLAQFLINPDLSTRALWQFLPAESSSSEAGETWGKKGGRWILPAEHLFHDRRVLLHAVNLRHGTDSFTYPPKDVVLLVFIGLKNSTSSAGFEPVNFGCSGKLALK
jgi:hypothetical protein